MGDPTVSLSTVKPRIQAHDTYQCKYDVFSLLLLVSKQFTHLNERYQQMNPISLESVLNEAMMDAVKARNLYRKTIDLFGPAHPFVNTVEAEQRHIDMFLPPYEKYAIPLPPEPGPDQLVIPETLARACQLGGEDHLFNNTGAFQCYRFPLHN